MNPDLRGVVLGVTGVSTTWATFASFAVLGFWQGIVVAITALIAFGMVGAGTESK